MKYITILTPFIYYNDDGLVIQLKYGDGCGYWCLVAYRLYRILSDYIICVRDDSFIRKSKVKTNGAVH